MDDLPDTFWAWLAGFVDGDGCVGIYHAKASNGKSYDTMYLAIDQKDRSILDWIQEKLDGAGSIYQRSSPISSAPMHRLQFAAADARALCQKMLPYLKVKQEAAREVATWEPTPRGVDDRHADKVEPALELRAMGLTYEQIGEITGVKAATVGYWIRTRSEVGV